MLSTVSPDTPMPEQVEEAYRLWLDAAGRNIYEVARILGGRRQTYQEWATKWRWRERAELEDVEGRDRAIRTAYHRLANAASAFTETVILAARCRVDAIGNHYALDDQGKRVDCPAPIAVRAASGGLQTLGISPVRAVTLDITHRPALAVSDAELDALVAAGDTPALLALLSGMPLPESPPPPSLNGNADHTAPPPHTTLPGDFTSAHSVGRVGTGPTPPVTVDAEFHEIGMNGVSEGEAVAEAGPIADDEV